MKVWTRACECRHTYTSHVPRWFRVIEELIKDPNVEITLKVGLLALIAGLATLFVSVLRERLHFWKRDRYKDVRR